MRRATSLTRHFAPSSSSFSSRSVLLASSSSSSSRSPLLPLAIIGTSSSRAAGRAYGTKDAHVPNPTAAHLHDPAKQLRAYTREEVAQHVYEDDCWVIVNGKVYNISTWADIHPGGRGILHAHAGGDATDMWVQVGHTARARALMERYCIGRVDEPKRYTAIESSNVMDIDDSGYQLPEGSGKEEILEDASSFRYSSR